MFWAISKAGLTLYEDTCNCDAMDRNRSKLSKDCLTVQSFALVLQILSSQQKWRDDFHFSASLSWQEASLAPLLLGSARINGAFKHPSVCRIPRYSLLWITQDQTVWGEDCSKWPLAICRNIATNCPKLHHYESQGKNRTEGGGL